MARLTRAAMQERTRARVLAAARAEFAEHGFRDAKVDRIADRADLTRGAVYSNFPGKRALYFAVLADRAERAPGPDPEPGRTPREAVAALARNSVTQLPLATAGGNDLARDLPAEIVASESARRAFAQLMSLDALLLGLALEALAPDGGRRVRVAEAVLTTLHGATQLTTAAPGFVEPFNVVSACEQLADLDLGDQWLAPVMVPPASPADDAFAPPPAADAIRGGPARLGGDGVVAVLGLRRASAVEQAVRAAPPGAEITLALVTGAPAELGPLARLVVAGARTRLWQAFPERAWPRLQVVHDEAGALAEAAGVTGPGDDTEAAVRVAGGRIVARAEGLGACHAAATAVPAPVPSRRGQA